MEKRVPGKFERLLHLVAGGAVLLLVAARVVVWLAERHEGERLAQARQAEQQAQAQEQARVEAIADAYWDKPASAAAAK